MLKTRIYVYGKNNLSIENFPTDRFHTYGNPYVECLDYILNDKKFCPKNATEKERKAIKDQYTYEYIFVDKNCEDIEKLYNKAIGELLENCKPPKITKDNWITLEKGNLSDELIDEIANRIIKKLNNSLIKLGNFAPVKKVYND